MRTTHTTVKLNLRELHLAESAVLGRLEQIREKDCDFYLEDAARIKKVKEYLTLYDKLSEAKHKLIEKQWNEEGEKETP